MSTIPDDFIGSSPNNNWGFEVIAAYHRYKELDHMSEVLEYAAKAIPIAEGDLQAHRTRYEAALRAATLRIEFLRKWPSAFEQHGGTIAHWERALTLLRTAEAVRSDGRRALSIFPRQVSPYPLLCCIKTDI